MADEKPIIDFGTAPRDLQLLIDRLKLADGIIVKISEDALKAGRNLASIQLPSDLAQFTAENQRLTAQIQAQSAALATLQTQYNNLSNQRRNSSQRTAEESVNQGILNRNAMEAARINSTLAGAYTRLSAEQSRASRNLQDLITRGRLATQTQREYDRELRIAQREFNTLNERVTAADRAVGRFNRNVGNYPMQAAKGIKDLLSAFGVVGGMTLIASIAKDIFNTTKELISLNNALKLVTDTQANFQEQQMFLTRISEAYGVEINGLTKQFTQFYVSAKDKISGREIQNIFESITKAGAAMGLSTQSQERAFMALNQMMSKGTIQAEELRGQLGEALPGSLGIMAKSLGVTEDKLGKMMKAGELLASDVLPKFAKQLEITYGIENVTRIESLTAAQNRFQNAWTNFIGGLDEDGNKLSSFFIKSMGVITKVIEGAALLLESDETTRKNRLAKFRQDGYEQTLKYYNSLDELKKEDLENDKAYTEEKIKQETAEFNRLKGRNLILKAITPERRFGMKGEELEALVRGEAEIKQNKEKMIAINNLLSSRIGNVAALRSLLETDKKSAAATKELTKEELKATEDRLKAIYDAAKKELELRLLKEETILNNELNSYEIQYKALKDSLNTKMQIIILDYNEQVRLAKGNAAKIKSADLDKQMAIIKQSTEGYNKLKAIRKKENEEQLQELKDIETSIKEYYDNKKALEDESLELETKSALASFALIDKKIERLKELKKATKDYLNSFTEEFASNAGFGETFNTFFKQFEDANGKMTTMFKQLLEGAETGKEKFAVYFNAIAQSAQEAFNFISNATAKNFDEEKTRLQSQYEVSLKYAGDNKAAQEKLAEDLEIKKKEIANREAKAKQKQAIFNIAIDTAQAIIGLWANPGFPAAIPLALVVGALGLAQIAAVSSQEIPQYWMGGTHDGGLMIVNDGKGSNYKETIVTPDGKIMKPQGRNVIMDAPIGTEIFTHDQWNEQMNNMLQGNGINWNMPQQNNNYGISKADMRDAMLEAIGEQPQYHSNFDANGATDYIMKKGNITRSASKRGNSTKTRFT